MKRHLSKIIIMLLALSLVVVVPLSGCAGTAETAEEAAEEVEEVAEEATEEVEEVAEEAAEEADTSNYKLASYWPAVHPYYESVKKGLAKHAEDFGVEVYSQIGTDWTQPTENEQVEALIAQGYNGLMVFPLDAAGANGLYEEVVAQGVYVNNYGAPTQEPTPASFTVATDVKAAAMEATERVCEAMDYKGGILNVLEVVTDPNTILRKEGVEEVVAQYPDVEIVQTIGDMNAIEECTEKVSNALAAGGDSINGIVTTGYNPTVATAQILTEMENDSIAFVGIDDDPAVLKAVEQGYITGTFGQNPYCQGYVTPLLLEYLIDGMEPKADHTFIDTFGVVITQDNLDTFMDELWQAAYDLADNAKSEYFK
ncbi:MAG: sugar ABC transporter substrate-binding protein [Actinomycetia bacterium]|nr:sugar ABC transporter substrate-binding protein [Actinomycetes bacterium]